MAGFGWIHIVAVAGDATVLDLLEGLIEIIEREDDEMFAEGPTVREGGHDGAIYDVPGELGTVFFDGDDFEEVCAMFRGGVTAEFSHHIRYRHVVATTHLLHRCQQQTDESMIIEIKIKRHGYRYAAAKIKDTKAGMALP